MTDKMIYCCFIERLKALAFRSVYSQSNWLTVEESGEALTILRRNVETSQVFS